MKKLLSIILATAMLISLIPAVFAADTEAEAGIKVVYDFYNADLAALEKDVEFPLNQLSYAASKGFWQYADNSDKSRTYVMTNSGTGFRVVGGYIYVCAAPTTPKYWLAVKLNVPKQGKYDIKFTTYTTGGTAIARVTSVNAFMFKADETINIKDLVNNTNGELNITNISRNTKKEYTIGTKELDAGEHYFVLNPYHTYDSTASPAVYLCSLTLTEDGTGTGNAIMGGKISGVSDTLEIGDAETVAATGYLSSTGDAISDFTYSVEGNAVEIAGDTVTAKEAGTATIIATSASAVEGCNTITKTVTVTAPAEPEEDPISADEFNAVEDKTAITSYNIGDVTAVAYTVGDAEENSISVSATPNTDGTYTLNAPACEGYNFLYWKKGLTEKKDVITYKPTGFVYAPTAGENNIVIAVYEKIGENTESKAEFYNANGQFIEATSGSFPTDIPSMAGYGDATGWQCYTDGKTYALTDSVTPDGIMLFVADYKDTLDMVKVNETDVPYGTEMSFTAKPVTGKKFKCWTRTDKDGNTEIVSIEDNYKFRAYEDCTIEEVDTDKTVVLPANTRKIVLDTFKAGSATALMAEFIGFKNDTVVEKGIMLGNNRIAMKSTGTQFTIIPDEKGTYKGYAIIKNTEDNAYTLITDGSYPNN